MGRLMQEPNRRYLVKYNCSGYSCLPSIFAMAMVPMGMSMVLLTAQA